jgi:acyl carrier protein
MAVTNVVSKEEIRKYIKENTFKESNLIEDSTLIFQEGFFDSMGFVMLLDFINEKFGVSADDDDLIEENFESINAINDFISRKLNS